MCGIAGSIRWDSVDDRKIVEVMTASLTHRGPDAGSVESLGPATLGHRRLSVIDTSARAMQPMQDEQNGSWIAYNGEVYNFHDLRENLKNEGCRFKTNSDTEVLLKGLALHGDLFIERVIGMFAIAYWDPSKQSLTLIRDRLGKKPLYFQQGAWGMAFASTATTLALHPEVTTEINPSAIQQFLGFGYVTGSTSIFPGVEKVVPGEIVRFKRNAPPERFRYWDLAPYFERKLSLSEADAVDRFTSLLGDAVEKRMISDVPLGSFLSGGIDSAAIVDRMTGRAGQERIQTFTIGFLEKAFDESEGARETAALLGVENFVQTTDIDLASSMIEIMPFIDEPFADTSMIPFYHLSAFAKENVTVALSGDGGDELFAGYITYAADQLFRTTGRLPTSIVKSIAELALKIIPTSYGKIGIDYKLRGFARAHGLSPDAAHVSWRTLFDDDECSKIMGPALADHLSQNSERLFQSVQPYFSRLPDAHWLDRMLYTDTCTWLPDDILFKVDRMSMAHGLEVRAPFLDHRIVEFAAGLPISMKMRCRKQKLLLNRYIHKRLPALLKRKKSGFNAPVNLWLKNEGRDFGHAMTTEGKICDWVDRRGVEKMWAAHLSHQQDFGIKLFALTSLGLWLSTHT